LNREEKRWLVAQEAAKLLYYKLVEEYNHAKEKASKILNSKALPSNLEVAIQLDKIANEVEGISRKKLIINLRTEALKVMKELKDFSPRLIGSVWRGTARKSSDIDIVTFVERFGRVLKALKGKFKILKIEYPSKTDKGITQRFVHIFIKLPSEFEVEIVVRSIEEMNEKNRCGVFGDFITGLTISQLQRILKTNPLQKFVPKKNRRKIRSINNDIS
jgi:predicted nucleotidyltransferase